MNDTPTLVETEARQLIQQRLAHAARPQLPPVPQRHRFADRLRRIADRIDN